jgi:hypothetical protein
MIREWMKSDVDRAAAALGMVASDVPAPDDAMGLIGIADSIGQASLTMVINECWIVLGVASLVALPVIIWLGPVASALPAKRLPRLKK